MTYAALGKLKKNSPEATLTAGIDDTTGTIPVDHLEYFHDEDGTLIVKGIVLGPDTSTITETEEITITGASGTTGAGNLTGGTRGVNADGTVGAAKAWDSGTVIKVTYTTGIHNQIADNFAKIQTTAVQLIYVDSAATGTGDGTSWTDAFTTIQEAINSLPTVLEHAVTIYVRKGASAYAATTVQQIIGKGSLTIRGEYYWTGQCATAGSGESQTKFNLTADDGASIEVGDQIAITHGYTMGLFSTVKTSTNVGGTTYEVEINTPVLVTSPTDTMWGNLGAGDYYHITKTVTGNFTITNTNPLTISGLVGNGAYILTNMSSRVILYVVNGFTTICYSGCNIEYSAFHCRYTNTIMSVNGGVTVPTTGISVNAANIMVATGASVDAIQVYNNGYFQGKHIIVRAEHSGGAGLYVSNAGGRCLIIQSAFTTGTYKGIYARYVSAVQLISVTNNASTPMDPASSTDYQYIGA